MIKRWESLALVSVMLLSALLMGCSADTEAEGEAPFIPEQNVQHGENAVSPIEGLSDEVYRRGLTFIQEMDNTLMIGQAEGEEQLNAVAPDGAPDIEALFEDDLYILWLYHNLKSVDTAAAEMNVRRREAGMETTIEQEYNILKWKILGARTEQDLWDIWNEKKMSSTEE